MCNLYEGPSGHYVEAAMKVDAPGHPAMGPTEANKQLFRELEGVTRREKSLYTGYYIVRAREQAMERLVESFLMSRAYGEYPLSWPEAVVLTEYDDGTLVSEPFILSGKHFRTLCQAKGRGFLFQ